MQTKTETKTRAQRAAELADYIGYMMRDMRLTPDLCSELAETIERALLEF